MNVGQIISIVKEKLTREEKFHKAILGIKSKSGLELVDYCLTQLNHPFAPIVSKINPQLEIIYRSSFYFNFVDEVKCRRLPRLSDFEIIKTIGIGGFSKVFQVRKKDTGLSACGASDGLQPDTVGSKTKLNKKTAA